MWVGLRETSREENRALELVTIAEAEEQFEPRVRAGHSIAVDRTVKLRGSLAMPVPIDGVLTVVVAQSHYRSLFRATDASPVCSGAARWIRMGEISPT